ncbi:hypothetical protein M2375_002868 [Comamonas sp. BIGb0152]|uniref:hypothetical protein n=1 Tax=Comamonas sp. BIGb0152 TaxID=2940601 RepID=UPI002169D945|nr:hypothetical protein [Comamonas sp. BIGb0152]MCS4294635.1 hypothetical protein [Comamonas sp. BIGb0152]
MFKYFGQKIIKSSFDIINNAAAASMTVLITIFCCLLTVFCISIYGNTIITDMALNGVDVKAYVVSVPLVLVLLATLYVFIKRKRHLNPRLFIGASILLSLSIQFIYYYLVHANWVSDFQHMWNLAGILAAEGRFIPNDIYEQRILPILLPMVYIFGNHPIIVPISNSFFLVCIMLMGYSIVQKTHGHYSAQIFTILWLACAEPLFSLKIPTHDLWGLFIFACISLCIVLFFQRKQKSISFLLGMAVISGALCIILDVQRELGGLVIVAWTVSLSIYTVRNKLDTVRSGENKYNWAMLAVAGIVFLSGSIALKNSHVIVSSDSLNYLKYLRLASLSPGFSPGSYAYANEFGSYLLKDLPPEAQKDTAQSLVLSDFIVQPEFRVSGIIYKTTQMAYLGGQHYFYQNGMESDSPILLKNIVNYNKIISIIICFLLLIKLKSALSNDKEISTIFSLSVLCILIGALTTVGEIQPRYLFPFWFFSAIVIASQYTLSPSSNLPQFSWWANVQVGLAIILVGAASLWLGLSRWYTPEHGRVLSPFSIKSGNDILPSYSPPLQLDKNAYSGRNNGIGKLGFTMVAAAPTDMPIQISASRELCLKERTSMRFGYVMPYVNPSVEDAFQLSLYFSGNEIWIQKLPHDGKMKNVLVENIAPANTCGTLEFKLISREKIFDSSGVQASRTEIYFPRLTKN